MIFKTMMTLGALVLGATAMAQVGVDGVKGVEWDGVSHTHVTYGANAPTSNFGNPTSTTSGAGYDVYVRSDANYLYGLFVATDDFNQAPGDFANLYLQTKSGPPYGSTLGFEIGDNSADAFVPGGQGGYSVAGYLTNKGFFDPSNGNVTQEFAVSWSFLTSDPDGMGFPKTVAGDQISFRLSQTFGYSVGGGTDYPTATRLGATTYNPQAVPEPASMAALALGTVGLLRRRAKK